MTFTLTINTDNAAFEDNEGRDEIARILRKVAADVEYYSDSIRHTQITIMDVNGNAVGWASSRMEGSDDHARLHPPASR